MQVAEHERGFDGWRSLRFVTFRLAVIPCYTMWVRALESLPLVLPPLQLAAMKTSLDLLLWSPAQHLVFFTSMAVLEGGHARDAAARCAAMLPQTLPASWAFWAPAQRKRTATRIAAACCDRACSNRLRFDAAWASGHFWHGTAASARRLGQHGVPRVEQRDERFQSARTQECVA